MPSFSRVTEIIGLCTIATCISITFGVVLGYFRNEKITSEIEQLQICKHEGLYDCDCVRSIAIEKDERFFNNALATCLTKTGLTNAILDAAAGIKTQKHTANEVLLDGMRSFLNAVDSVKTAHTTAIIDRDPTLELPENIKAERTAVAQEMLPILKRESAALLKTLRQFKRLSTAGEIAMRIANDIISFDDSNEGSLKALDAYKILDGLLSNELRRHTIWD
jgi:hypothetical protein